MECNEAYTKFETAVIRAYDQGRLDKATLAALMEPYRGTDIDTAGGLDLVSHDGKLVREIVIETWGLELPETPWAAHRTDKQAWDDHEDALDALLRRVTELFGWR